MIFKLRFGKWRLTITLAPVIDVIGVNSLLQDGNHILMWDFDNVTKYEIMDELNKIQLIYGLPNIYLLMTKPDSNYIAYCFKRCTWSKCKMIIASTSHVCENFFKWGVFRKRFTLRVSPKCGRKPKLAYVLKSGIPEDANVEQLRSWVMYETLADGHEGAIIKLGEK